MILAAFVTVLAQAGPPGEISLDQALAQARETRPRVAQAGALVQRARGELRVATTIPNPTLLYEHSDLAPTQRLTATQPMSWLVRIWSERTAGQAGVRRAEADSTQTIALLGEEVRTAFYVALAAVERYRLIGEQTALADSLLVLAQRRVSAGDISELERDQIAQEAARARQSGSRALEASRISATALARAVGLPATDALRPTGALDHGLQEGEPPLIDDAAQFPILRSVIEDSIAAEARLRSAQLARLPVPALMAKQETGGIARDNMIIGFSVPVPSWNIGGGFAATAQAEARYRAAIATETRMQFQQEALAARTRLEETRNRARVASETLLPNARRLRAGMLRLYEEGQASLLAVLEAIRTENAVAVGTLEDLLAFQEARARLLALLGRWE
jgi:cobalt-zinc-cadmium efflux system outer membrane protein